MVMVTPAQKRLVQDSSAQIAPIADDAAALFYRRARSPGGRTQPVRQVQKLAAASTTIHAIHTVTRIL